mmetsp:Transcript_17258/g.56401  ORF Transcript_17258/g.56401 Transcript_17258/m.56401 type:complete len:92 (+) Transcript_17258:176-451(+)
MEAFLEWAETKSLCDMSRMEKSAVHVRPQNVGRGAANTPTIQPPIVPLARRNRCCLSVGFCCVGGTHTRLKTRTNPADLDQPRELLRALPS